jgi:drug/metabolite transporter (DMT)-like permease
MSRYHLGLVYCAVVWGATFYVVKDALDAVDPVAMVAYRFLLAAAVLLPFVWRRIEWKRELRSGLILGGFLGASYLTQTVGLKYTTASNSGFITGLFVVFVPLFVWLVERQRPNATQWGAVAVAVAGLWLLTDGVKVFTIGDALTVLTAMAYAAHVIATGRLAHTAHPLVLAFHQFWIIGAGSLALTVALGRPLGIASASGAGVVVFLALVPTLSAFVLQLVGQRHVPAFTATLIFLLEPVFAAVFAWTLGGEPLVALHALGGALIVAAMLLGELPTRRTVAADGVPLESSDAKRTDPAAGIPG